MNSAKTEKDFIGAAGLFDEIAGYKDSAALAEDCRRGAKDAKYAEAEALLGRGDSKSVRKAKAIYESLSSWRDSEKKLALCDEKALEATRREEKAKIEKERRGGKVKFIIPAVAVVLVAAIIGVFVLSPLMAYNNAVKLMESGEYDKAIETFKNLDGYGESEQNILKAKYMKATYLSDNEKYEEAITVFESINNYKDSKTQIENCKTGILEREYQKAVALAAEKKYDEAIEIFKSLEDYKDSEEQIITLKWGNMKVGDIITFGSYEQDNNLENGTEPIEWQVLDVQDGKALVISKYGLDCKPYNTENTSVTWETCSLRKWLNNKFMNGAFSTEEQEKIVKTKVSTPDNPEYGTSGGNDTEDNIFLLSIEEVKRYFSSNAERQCKPSAYAKEQGVYVADNGNCWWWLSSTGKYQFYTAYVYYEGSVDAYGDRVNNDVNAVRPAMWIDISATE